MSTAENAYVAPDPPKIAEDDVDKADDEKQRTFNKIRIKKVKINNYNIFFYFFRFVKS